MGEGEFEPITTTSDRRLQRALIYAFLAGVSGGIAVTLGISYLASGVTVTIGG